MSRKILLVCEDAAVRSRLVELVGKKYSVLTATSSEETLALLCGSFRVLSAVLLTVGPKELEALKLLRDNAIWRHIPVIAVAEAGQEIALRKAVELGVNAYMTEPYDGELLMQLLGSAISLCENASIANAMRRDKLTGLFNRDTFFSEAGKMLARHEPGYYTLACFDIDSFKVINDQCGTHKGDEVLKFVADCINDCAMRIDGICCRLTADKFAMLYPSEYTGSETIIDSYKTVSRPICIDRRIKLRIGLYKADDLSVPISFMFDRATLAEESIKGKYGAYYAEYDEELRAQMLREQEIINEMYDALRSGQFEPWLQPQYNHATGALIGAEALVRWRHPVRGLVPPGDFIPIFERNGFIYELDKYIWEQVCILLRRHIDEGRTLLPISVNISRCDVFVKGFFDVITGLIEKYSIPIELLRLEITESAFAEGTGRMVSIINKLIDFGFTVEIDDFGSGYSSLNTLKDVPAQILKLDMKFFEDAGNTPRCGNIVESVVRMSKWLGMSVIAEGVESGQQADYLKSIGCYYIQGYYYARPMPIPDYEALARGSTAQPRLGSLETVETYNNFNFWDPKSMDTLIFNSYVGGAIIIEYLGGKAEAIRVNDRFKQEFSDVFVDGVAVSEMSPEECMDEENLRIMYDNIENAVKTGAESTCEVRVGSIQAKREDALYMRCTVRVIARADNRYLLYCMVFNISEVRRAEAKEEEAQKKHREAADRLQSIMEHVGCGITAGVLSADGPRLLFANDKYYEIMGYTRESFESSVIDIYSLVLPEDREMVREHVKEAEKRGGKSDVCYRVRKPDGEIIWVKTAISTAKLYGIEGTVELAIYSDISTQKKTDEQMLFLNDMAGRLLAQPDPETGIYDALHRLLEYFGGARAYVFEFDEESKSAFNSYEVCAPGISSEKERLQNVPLTIMKPWLRAFKQKDFLSITDTSKLGDSRAEERETLMSQDIRSLVASPLRRDGKIIGFIGIDDTSRRQERVENLSALGAYMAVLLTRRDLLKQVSGENQALLAIMGGVPGGFVRMRIMPDGAIVPLYFSDNFKTLVGMDTKELLQLYARDVRAGVHPDDIAIVQEAIDRMQREGIAQNVRYRLKSGSGGYVWVTIFGKLHESSTGERFLNIYYADTTEQRSREAMQSELLDNLPCGAALYELKDGRLSVIHRNRRYWEMIGRERKDEAYTELLDTVHPGDRDIIWRELDSAIRLKRDFIADIRVRGGGDEFIPFHIVGKLVAQNDGHYMVYTTYTPIAANAMSLQEMLPIALSTMMEASPDYTFIKDKELRYVCISRSAAQLLGFESDRELVGRSDYELFDRETADRYAREDRAVLEKGEAISYIEESLPMKDSSIRYGGVSKYPLRDVLGNVVGVYCVSRDITQMRETESQLKLLTDSIPGGLGIFEFGPEGAHTLYINEGFYRYSGYSREEYLSITEKDPLAHIFPEDRPGVLDYIKALQKGKESGKDCVYRCRTKNGGYRWFSLSGSLAQKRGKHYTINVVQYDITEQKEAEQRLRTSEEEYRLATIQSDTSICRYRVADRSLLIPPNTSTKLVLPLTLPDVPDSRVKNGSISEDTVSTYLEFYDKILRGEKTGSAKYRAKLMGQWCWLEAYFTTIFDDDNKPVSAVISFRDVTEQTENEIKTRKLAQTDPLTGVLNRKAFAEKVTELISQRKSGSLDALIMLDLDSFKKLNDKFGHVAGDRTLIEVSRALRQALRGEDLVCRLGGDEFMAFLRDVPDRTVIDERTRRVCRLIHESGSLDVDMSTSVGIVVCPDDGVSFSELYRKADTALYHVKANGKDNYAFYSEDMEPVQNTEWDGSV